MITLRPYQQQYESEILDFFRQGGKHAIVQAPTGSGKTIMFSSIAQKAARKGNKILIITDRAELLMQTGGALQSFHLHPFYIEAGCKFINLNHSVYVAMALTLKNRINKEIWQKWLKNIDLVIIDECHQQVFNYLFQDDHLANHRVIGFTATPKRGGKQRQLAFDYEEIISCVTVEQLIQLGYLVRDDYYGIAGADTTDLKIDAKKGDFAEGAMFERFNSTKLYSGVVKNWLKIAPGSQTIIFCVNIEHVIHTCQEFQNNGIDARFVVSGMSTPKEPGELATDGRRVRYADKMRLLQLYQDAFNKWSGHRDMIIHGFKEREFPVLVNAGIATTGFDSPAIETVIINRATLSEPLWLQMVGRGSRISPGKTHFNLLDFGGNAERLGHYSQNRVWSLWHEESKGGGVPAVKECGYSGGRPVKQSESGLQIEMKISNGCRRLILASYTICPFCGFKYPKKKAKEIELVGVVYDSNGHVAKKVKRVGEMNDQELHDYWKAKNHKTMWLWRQLWFRGGEAKIRQFGEFFGWRQSTIEKGVLLCKNLENTNRAQAHK